MPHVMPKWYRENPGLVDEKTKQNREDHADLERREFIREAALRFSVHDGYSSWDEVWKAAKAFWNAKPEDC